MADAIISAVVENLTSMVLSSIKEEVKLVSVVNYEIKKLVTNFKSIQALLDDAEEQEVKEASVKNWLFDLKAVSYDMDDVLDEWKTWIYTSQLQHQRIPIKITSSTRFIKLLLFFGFVGTLVILFTTLNLTIGDIFQCIQAFFPTGWAILQIAQACRRIVKGMKMWSSVKALARGSENMMGSKPDFSSPSFQQRPSDPTNPIRWEER